jgi:hypothetical protein
MRGKRFIPGVTVRMNETAWRFPWRNGSTKRLSGRSLHLWRRMTFRSGVALARAPEPGDGLSPITEICENNFAI